MRSLQQFLSDYGESHQNPVNQWVHFFCVPLIFISTGGLFWLIPLGQWLGLSAAVAYWVNGATVAAALTAIVYIRLGLGAFILMIGWFLLSLGYVLVVQASALSLGWTSVVIWVLSWAVQVWGHKVEGKKPSFVEDLVFLLIGPIFVSVEIGDRLGLPVTHAQSNAQGHDKQQA